MPPSTLGVVVAKTEGKFFPPLPRSINLLKLAVSNSSQGKEPAGMYCQYVTRGGLGFWLDGFVSCENITLQKHLKNPSIYKKEK